MSESQSKQKIAILGGGCGAMTAAFELTKPGLRDRFDVVVYQMGWRLGGKGASGRSMRTGFGQRIEEHGLHIWAGFYDNAFEVMKSCYDELKRGPEVPIRSMSDAFSPHDLVTLIQRVDEDHWKPHYLMFPERPGDPRQEPDPLEDFSAPVICRLLCDWLLSDFCTCVPQGSLTTAPDPSALGLPGHMAKALSHIGRYWVRPEIWVAGESAPEPWMQFIHLAQAASNALANGDFPLFDDGSEAIMFLLDRFSDGYIAHLEDLERGPGRPDHTVRKIAVDLATAAITGFFRDRLVLRGFESIDHLELRQWLRLNGARESSLDSFIMRAAYDYTFAYTDGETAATGERVVPESAQLAAGTGIKGILRVLLTYRGHVFWHMNAGMGDIVFAPIYQVLKQRGVRFEFFHRVDDLDVGKDELGRPVITAIKLGQQAKVSGGKDYEPLITVKGLPCWPSTPKWRLLEDCDNLQQGGELKDGGFDLEWIDTRWKDVGKLTLERGKDFHQVVLGIPVGDQGRICSKLAAKDERWRDMLRELKTVPTLALQLWSHWSAEDLGWEEDQPALATSFAQPFNSWADLSLLVERENWPEDGEGVTTPRSIHYFCGPLRRSYRQAAENADDYVKKLAEAWFKKNIKHLWPKAPADPESALHEPPTTGGNAFDSQFWRANTRASDLYIMSVPDSTRYRLLAGESGFANLFLAGDWVRTDLSAGCVECAVMAGRHAAEALIEETRPRYWETELLRFTVRSTEGAAVIGAGVVNEVIEAAKDSGLSIFITTVRGISDLVIVLGDTGAAALRGIVPDPSKLSQASIAVPSPGDQSRDKPTTPRPAAPTLKPSPVAQMPQSHANFAESIHALNRAVAGIQTTIVGASPPALRRGGQSELPVITGATTPLVQSMSDAINALNKAVLGSQGTGSRLQGRSASTPLEGMVHEVGSTLSTATGSLTQILRQISATNRR